MNCRELPHLPGWTVTEGVKKSIPGFYERFKASMRNLEQGADTIVWLALEVRTGLGLRVYTGQALKS